MNGGTKTIFAFARLHRAMDEPYLRQQEAHGRRESPTAAVRPGADPALSLFWSRYGSATCEYVNDLRSYLHDSGARTRKGAALTAHLLLGISSDWLAETGGVHDGSGNTRVLKLFEQAKVFAETHFGGLYAMRMDLDERGAGVVDCFVAPVHMRRGRPRKDGSRGVDVAEVSVKDALLRLQKAVGGGKSFSALQTLWAHHAASSLDDRIVRGEPKAVTGRWHLTVAEYRQSIAAEKAWHAERDGQRATILNTLALIAQRDDDQQRREEQIQAERQRLAEDGDRLARDDLRLAAASAALNERTVELQQAVAAIEQTKRMLDSREAGLAAVVQQQARAREALHEAEREVATEKASVAETARAVEVTTRELRKREVEAVQARDADERRREELAASSSRIADDNARNRKEQDRAHREAERLQQRAAELDLREADMALAAHAIAAAEAERRKALRERERGLEEANAVAQRREAAAAANAESARSARAAADQAFAAVSAEREELAVERKRVASTRARLAAEQAGLLDCEAKIADLERLVVAREGEHEARVGALEAGLRGFADGSIRKAADLAERPELVPAFDFLKQVGKAIKTRVERLTSNAQERETLANARLVEAEAAIAAAKEQEEAARKVKAAHESLLSNFEPELKRLRRIRKWAAILAEHAQLPALRHLGPRIASALDGLVAELGSKARSGPER